MRSLVCRSYGTSDGIAVEELPDPFPGPGEVLVRLSVSNVAYVDRLIVRGGYQVRPRVPFVPGVVGAGVVLETGHNVNHLQPGSRVVVLKSDYGTWSTHVVAPAWAVVAIPSNVSDTAATAAIEAYGTASYALEDRGGIRAGERVLILGASGAVGAAAVDIALHLDAHVIAYTSDPYMWDDYGVKPHLVLDRHHVHLREAMRSVYPDGVDLVMDPVGGDIAESALRSLASRGRYLVVGFASGTIPKLPTNYVLLRNRSVIGVEWATWITDNPQHLARTLEVVLNRLARGVLHIPPANVVTLEDLPSALQGPVPSRGLVRTVVSLGGAESDEMVPEKTTARSRARVHADAFPG